MIVIRSLVLRGGRRLYGWGLVVGVRLGQKWNLREKELVERAVKAIEHFIDVKSGSWLSKRAMPKNGY